MSAYIYLVTNTINGKQYVGFSIEPDVREYKHTWESKSGSPQAIHRAMRKYGVESFTFDIIFEHDDPKWTLKVMEPHFIAWYDTYENGYNATLGGEGTLGRTLGEDSIRKQSDARKLKWTDPEYRASMTGTNAPQHGRTGDQNPQSVPIQGLDPETNEWERFCGMADAARILSERTGKRFDQGLISKTCAGKQKSHHGWLFATGTDLQAPRQPS